MAASRRSLLAGLLASVAGPAMASPASWRQLLRRSGGPAVAPAVAPAVRETVSAVGDSWTRGNEQEISRSSPTVTATDRWTNQLATLLGVAESLTPGQTGWTTGIINAGYGGQTSATINTNHAALVTADALRAGDVAIIGPGKNDTSGAAGYTNVLAGADAILARLTSDRKIIWRPRGATGPMGSGSSVPASALGSWVRSKRIQWAYRSDARRAYFFELDRYYSGVFPNGSPNNPFTGAGDDVEAAGEGGSTSSIIASLRASAGADKQHPNYLTAPMWAAAFQPVVLAMQNKAVFVLDETIPVAYDVAAGSKIEVHFKGYVTSASISTDDPTNAGLYTIAMKAASNSIAELTRTSVSAGNIPAILNLRVTANGVDTLGAAKSHIGNIRLLPSMAGAASTVPRGITFSRDTNATATSRRFPLMASEDAPFANGPRLSIVLLGLKVGEDGTTMAITSINTTRVLVQRGTGNKLSIRIQDAAGTDLANWTTVTTNFTVAGGVYNLALSYDYNSGTPLLKVWAWNAGSSVDIAPATGFGAGVTNIGMDQHLRLFSTATAQAAFKGSLKAIWMDDRYMDFSSAAQRDKFFNSTTGLPVDLGATGTVDAVQPKVYLAGDAADWMQGTNRGSAGQFGFNDNWLLGFGANTSDPTPY